MPADFMNFKINPYGAVKNTRIKSAASTNLSTVTTVAANVIAVIIQNNSAGVKYVKLYDKASNPSLGSDIPKVSFNAPAGQTWTHDIDAGIAFNTGLAVAITGGFADTDATNTAVDDVHLTIIYAN